MAINNRSGRGRYGQQAAAPAFIIVFLFVGFFVLSFFLSIDLTSLFVVVAAALAVAVPPSK